MVQLYCIIAIDIDECALGIARCLPTAICTNTNGSYLCFCPQGYSGDGVSMCKSKYMNKYNCYRDFLWINFYYKKIAV